MVESRAAGRVFVSYRRGDTAGHAGRLFDRVRRTFGEDRVFMDVAGIAPGDDFAHALDEAVSSCDAFLAVIGRDWVNAVDSNGHQRLADTADFVRLELKTALARGVRVVPVLVDGAALPRENELPDDCKPLVRRQAFELRDNRWEADTEALCDALLKGFTVTGPTQARSRWAANQIWVPLLAVVTLAGLAIWYVSRTSTEPTPSPPSASSATLGAALPAPSASSPSGSIASEPTSAVAVPAPFELAGSWSGLAREGGHKAFRVQLVVSPSCALGNGCGTISVSHVPCYGDISLLNSKDGDYEFNVVRFDARSSSQCQTGAGEHFRLKGETLVYTTTYGVSGTLTRQ